MTKTGKRIVILGATSAIAEATARIWAAEGARFVLVARNQKRLEAIAADLKIRGAHETTIAVLDCSKADARSELGKMVEALGGLDVLLLAYGVLGDQRQLAECQLMMEALIQTNFTSVIAWSLAASAILERQRSGVLITIGSVAGDRGRRSNFIYGASKGGLDCIVQGIAHQLAPFGARAVVVKPGLVDTPMTATFPKTGPLWRRPESVAAVIARSAEKSGTIVYAPAYWRLVMLAIRNLPSVIFNRLSI